MNLRWAWELLGSWLPRRGRKWRASSEESLQAGEASTKDPREMPSGQWGEACFPSGVGCGERGAPPTRFCAMVGSSTWGGITFLSSGPREAPACWGHHLSWKVTQAKNLLGSLLWYFLRVLPCAGVPASLPRHCPCLLSPALELAQAPWRPSARRV